MHVVHITGEQFSELSSLPTTPPAHGFYWIACARREFELQAASLQRALSGITGSMLVDLHVSDLLNNQLPSHFDYTSWYDILVFRRLTAAAGSASLFVDAENGTAASARRALQTIDTSPVGFAVFDRVLLTIHPADCSVREFFVQRLATLTHDSSGMVSNLDGRNAARLPTSAAELMLRMVNHMVDSYLDLRRLLTRQLGYLQQQLLDPRSHFDDWQVLLESRNTLNALEDNCEDQRSAVQEWIDALDEWPEESEDLLRRERELLRLRSRDVLEHIERVLSHVRRLQQSAETSVQMHFSAIGHRTNDIMRTLTVLTAVFMPLNLITGFFGMNFDDLPLIHTSAGVWIASGLMLVLAAILTSLFWRRRYLGER